MILSDRRSFPLFVAGIALLQAGVSLDGFAAGAESAARELPELGRSFKAIASLLLFVPVGMLIDRLRARTLLLAMSLVAVVVAGLGWFGFFPYAQVEGLPGIALYGLVVGLAGGMLIVAVTLASESYVPAVAGRDRLLRANALVFAATAVVGLLVGLVFDAFRRLSLPVVMVPLVAAVMAFWMMRTPVVVAARRVSFMEVVRLARTQPVVRAIGAYLVLTALAEPAASGHRLDLPSLRMGPITIGLVDAAVTVAGAGLALLLGRRAGMLRLAWTAVFATQPFALLLVLADDTPWGLACQALGRYVPVLGWTMTAIALLALRQKIVPDGMLGRTAVVLTVIAIPAMFAGMFVALLAGTFALPLGVVGLLVAALPLRKAERVADPETETPVAV